MRWNAYCITDEIYEHILYDGAEHISMARIDGMRERSIVINGMSKTYSVTGWRVAGHCSPGTTAAIRKVHYFLTAGAAAPFSRPVPWPSSRLIRTIRNWRGSYHEKRARLFENSDGRRFYGVQAARRLLHHDGHFRLSN